MYALSHARRVLAAVDLLPGLAVSEVHDRLQQGLRLRETGQRILAFYLTEMDDRRLHQDSGHSGTIQFAEDRLGLDRRRTKELIAVGRKLLSLPAIDGAFCEQQIGWSKLLQLVKVATPEHDEAWLARALELTCRQLSLEVKLAKPGGPPRKPGDRKGLPEVRFDIRASVGVLTHRKLDLAQKKLSAERGTAVDVATLLDVVAEVFLNMEEDGSVKGRIHVPSSLYRIVVRPGGDGEGLVADSDLGPLPVENSACIRCDGECVHADDDAPEPAGGGEFDPKTPPALRRRVLVRDAHKCRCCGGRDRLMVHHIRYRSRGGRTRAWNLITLCASCHALVHEGLLVLEGKRAHNVRFLDAEGESLHPPGQRVGPATLLRLSRPPRSEPAAGAPHPAPVPITLDTVPDAIDGAWWRRHAPLLRVRGDKGIELREGAAALPLLGSDAPDVGKSAERSARLARPFSAAFAGVVGQDALLRRLDTSARGSRARGLGFPHTLFVGPPGTGKTMLARGIAAGCGARLCEATGPLLQDAFSLVGLLSSLEENDMLFLDEIHAVPRAVLETLYQALAECSVSLTLHAGVRSRAVRLGLPAFTLLAATTEACDLPDALHSRFGLHESLGYYAVEDLTALVTSAARARGFTLGTRAASRLAACARGTPREALRLMERVLDEAASRQRSALDHPAMNAALRRLGYDRAGLTPDQRRYLALLQQSPAPIPLERLSRMLGVNRRTVLRHLEPFLFRRGLVRMTARGRTAVHPPRLLEA